MNKHILLTPLYNYISSRVAVTLGEEIVEKLNIVCVISKFLSIEEIAEILLKNGFEQRVLDERIVFETKYLDRKTGREVLVTYYLQIDSEREILLFLTQSPKRDILRTLIPVIERQNGFYVLWISPRTFQDIQNKIYSEHPYTTVPLFTATRRPYYRFKCKIRPREQRSIQYQGSDGRETLEEFKQYYGMLPRIIDFRVPDLLQFRIDYRGIFTFEWGEVEYINEIINLVLETITQSRRIIDKSKFEYVPVKTETKTILIPKSTSWVIELKSPLEYEELGAIMDLLTQKNNFLVYDYYAEKGSLYWAATVRDIQKQTLFAIKSNGKKIFVLPRYNPSFDSFLRFYHFFAENVDAEATVEEVSG